MTTKTFPALAAGLLAAAPCLAAPASPPAPAGTGDLMSELAGRSDLIIGAAAVLILLIAIILVCRHLAQKKRERNALCVLHNTANGAEWFITRRRVIIGRDKKSDIRLTDQTVSSCHCTLAMQEDGRWQLHDAGSVNKIYYRGKVCDDVDLVDGSVFELGTVELRFNILNPQSGKKQRKNP